MSHESPKGIIGKPAQASSHPSLIGDLNRLTSELNKLTGMLSEAPRPELSLGVTLDESRQKRLRQISRARLRRKDFFPDHLFADPAWDMLLELYQSELSQIRISVTSLCAAALVPPTTALRWLKTLEDERLVLRRQDPTDGRRVFVALSKTGLDAISTYFDIIHIQPGA